MTRHKILQENKSGGKTFSKNTLFGILISICVALQVFFTIGLSARGAQISNLEQELDQLVRKNRELEEILVRSTSLIQLREKANELGFSKGTNTYYIEKGDSYAMRTP